jgi:site-specific DNA recombinase
VGTGQGDTTMRGQVDRGTGILNNACYVGRIEWNRCSYVRNPKTGRRVARPNLPEEWEVMDAPELRIVDDELWGRVKRQQDLVRTEMARDENGQALNRAHRAKHLLSGLIICGSCGEPFAIRNATQYGCRNHRSRGTCDNRDLVDRKHLEKLVAQAIDAEWLTTVTVESLYADMEAAMLLEGDSSEVERAALAAALTRTKNQIDRLVSAIADGGHSEALIDKLAQLESEAGRIKTELDGLDASSAPIAPLDREQVAAALRTIKEGLPMIFDDTENPLIADIKTMVRNMIDKIVVTPRAGQEATLAIHGTFAGVMNAAGLLEHYEVQTTKPPRLSTRGLFGSLVAGTGFEPVTFRL